MRSRPKTSITSSDAVQYSHEGVKVQTGGTGSNEEAEVLVLDPSTEIFFTPEVKLSEDAETKSVSVNEFRIGKTIGRGSYSKVKHVIR